MNGELDPRYVHARSVLLDALEALRDHLDQLVLVGAQAVYLRTGAGELEVLPFTEDADLALDPRGLATEPLLEQLLGSAGFVRGANPGDWRGAHGVIVDLMVPDSLSLPGGRRVARIPPHASHAARKAAGLEASMVDSSVETVAAFNSEDGRSVAVRVAGPAALLVAKAFKLGERADTSSVRVQTKDALDVYRLLMAAPLDDLVARFDRLLGDPTSSVCAREAIAHLEGLFASVDSLGPDLVARALAPSDQPDTGRDASHRLAQALLAGLSGHA